MKNIILLGAGASSVDPYNYPLGSELVKNIIEVTTKYPDTSQLMLIKGKTVFKNINRKKTGKALKEVSNRLQGFDLLFNYCYSRGIDTDKIEYFNKKLQGRFEFVNSIDEFLSNELDQDMVTIGKAAIAISLLSYEKILVNNNNSWIRDLLSKHNPIKNRLADFSNSKFIVFNYDRVLEYRLIEYINTMGTDVLETQESLKILHVYGQLSPQSSDLNLSAEVKKEINKYGSFKKLTEQYDESNTDSRYLIHQIIDHATKSIKVVHEDSIDDSRIKNDVNEFISFNEFNLFILGFGFNDFNLKRLGLTDGGKVFTAKNIYATMIGLPEDKQQEISSSLPKGTRIIWAGKTAEHPDPIKYLLSNYYSPPR